MEKKYYALKLLPPRSTFFYDITEEERATMKQHSLYWRDLMGKGFVVVFGPVLDPKAAYGFGIVEADDENQIKQFIAGDPARNLGTYEYYPMLAVIAGKQE
jgi:uncharacterized protein